MRYLSLVSPLFLSLNLLVLTEPAPTLAEIEELRFAPPIPQPGSMLSLRIALRPRAGGVSPLVEVRLVTWTDLDNDCTYGSPGERQSQAPLTIRDNETGDREPAPNEILIDIQKVPAVRPPNKYTGIVSTGSHSRSTSIVLPSAAGSGCSPGRGSALTKLAGPARVSLAALQKLGGLRSIFAKRSPGDVEGEHNLYICDLRTKRLSKVAGATTGVLAEPSWSPDGGRLAMTLDQGGERVLIQVPRGGGQAVRLTGGPDDRQPHWLPDGRRLLFLRGSRLYVIDTADGKMIPLAVSSRVDRVLAVTAEKDGGFAIVYEAPDPEIPIDPTQDFFLLQLSAQLEPRGEALHLAHGPAWLLLGQISPVGDRIALIRRNQLYLASLPEGETTLLTDDSYIYKDPVWSPDGMSIAVLSSRPE